MIYKIPDKNPIAAQMPGLKSIFSEKVKGNIKSTNHLGAICMNRKKAVHEFQKNTHFSVEKSL